MVFPSILVATTQSLNMCWFGSEMFRAQVGPAVYLSVQCWIFGLDFARSDGFGFGREAVSPRDHATHRFNMIQQIQTREEKYRKV
jgi:hypothetical protein